MRDSDSARWRLAGMCAARIAPITTEMAVGDDWWPAPRSSHTREVAGSMSSQRGFPISYVRSEAYGLIRYLP